MINSILAYTEIDWTGDRPSAKEIVDAQEKKYKNYLKEYIDFLGKDRVIELVQEQMDIIEDVDWDTSTDSEGLSYNSIKYKESFDKSLEEKLVQSDSDKAFKKNVATEIKAGKDPKQAVAIAYSVKRKNESASTHTEKEKEVASDIEWYFSIPKKLTYKYLRINNINLDEYENEMLDNYDEFIDKLADDIVSNLWQVTDKKYSFTADIKESVSTDAMQKLEDDGWTVLSHGIRGNDSNHYWLARKMNKDLGKAEWKAINDKTGDVIDITYEQALGREPIGDSAISNLSKKLGKILLPKSVKESNEIKRYSDVVPKEKRKYWYFTTHGIQPGSVPKDVNILEVRDGVNDKGTKGAFVLLDAILNTSELKNYDMRELAPKTECLGESLDIFNEDFQQKLKNELQGKLQYHYKKLGYTSREIEDYIMPVYKTEFRKGYGDDGSDALFIWVGAEVDYEELEELANVLNRVIRKYDKEAYFEPETAGRLISVLWSDGTNESLNESDEEWHDTADREQADEPDYIPDEMDRYEAIAHKTVYDSDGFTTDYTLYFDHDENNYFTVFGDNDLYGPEDSEHDWDFGPNEDEALEWFEDYEGFVDDDDVDLELTDDDLEAGQWYE